MTGQAKDFASLLRRFRAGLGLTQEELAERAGLSTRAISDLERGVKTRPHRYTVDQLIQALNLPAAEQETFIAASRSRARRKAADPPPDSHRRSSLPVPHHPLLGRGTEIEAITAILRQPGVRLLTLTGTGGTGKTRLAIEIATTLADDYPDGVFLVSLAPLSDHRLVGPTIALSLGLRESDDRGLVRALADQRSLLVLDNFEHLLGAAGLVAELVTHAPGLTVLVTSRAPLEVMAEREFLVLPLPVPPLDGGEVSAAVALFIDRAKSVRPDLEVTPSTVATIAEICRRLDGLPLAIELAAARSRLLSPQAIAARLERRLPLLTSGLRDAPDRHQTLHAALSWSYDLLSIEAQELFRRLSVFSGGFTLDSAEALEAGIAQPAEPPLLDRLGLLTTHSLLDREDGFDGEPRFSMLETVREYGLEALKIVGEAADVERRHAGVFANLAESAEPELVGPRQLAWFELLEAEHGNLHAALAWTLVHDPPRAIAMTGALIRFWDHHGHVAEGLRWIATALDSPEGRVSPLRGKLLWGGATLGLILGHYDQAVAWLTEAVPAALSAGDKYHAGFALNTLGTVTADLGDTPRARAYHEHGLALLREVGDRDGIAALLGNVGHDAMMMGDYTEAIASCGASLAMYRQLGSAHGTASMLSELGQAMVLAGQFADAAPLLREGLVHAEELGNNIYRVYFLFALAVLASREAQWQRAARLFGALDAFTAHLTYTFPPFHDAIGREAHAIVVDSLGADEYLMAWTAGGAMPKIDVSAYALAIDPITQSTEERLEFLTPKP